MDYTEQYTKLSTDELLRLHAERAALTSDAKSCLARELRARQLADKAADLEIDEAVEADHVPAERVWPNVETQEGEDGSIPPPGRFERLLTWLLYATCCCFVAIIAWVVLGEVLGDVRNGSLWPTTLRVDTDMDSFWLKDEERTCETYPDANGGIAVVACNSSGSHRDHNIPVKFWGGVDRNVVSGWKCRREGDDFVCRAIN